MKDKKLSTPKKQLDRVYEEVLGERLALIEELRGMLGKEGIECPGVLVVGAQSAGKSSVLERLTGVSFPRGENTCTRLPTIVQMNVDPNANASFALISNNAEFLGATRCDNVSKIGVAITEVTSSSVSASTPIADKPIHIRFTRKSGPVMTLIDLPGITHLDTKNTKFDIHAVTAGMVKKYVSNENMVILVVIPANDDFSNSEALRIAQSFDPEGVRTIGVVSKCDLVPERSDIVQKLQMIRENDVKLALGFVAVRNKGPSENSRDILAMERTLFQSHPVLKELQDHEWGYHTLSAKIVDLQSQRVNMFIPEVRSLVNKRLAEVQQKLSEVGNAPGSASERRIILVMEVEAVCRSMLKHIRAETKDNEKNIASKTHKMALEFSRCVQEKIPDFLSDKFRTELQVEMEHAQGYGLPNFLSDTIFRRHIFEVFLEDNFPSHTYALVEDVGDLMKDILEMEISGRKAILTYPRLKSALIEKADNVVNDACERARTIIKGIFEAEQAQLFTLNFKYVGAIDEAFRKLQDKFRMAGAAEECILSNSGNDRQPQKFKAPQCKTQNLLAGKIGDHFLEKCFRYHTNSKAMATRAATELQLSLQVYSEIVKDRLFDIIPMIVRGIVVHSVQDTLQMRITSSIDDEDLENLFIENEKNRIERKRLISSVEGLKEARQKLRRIK